MTMLNFWKRQSIPISDNLMKVIEEMFERGGGSRFQINDVEEEICNRCAQNGDDFENNPLLHEAEALRKKQGEFYIERKDVL